MTVSRSLGDFRELIFVMLNLQMRQVIERHGVSHVHAVEWLPLVGGVEAKELLEHCGEVHMHLLSHHSTNRITSD